MIVTFVSCSKSGSDPGPKNTGSALAVTSLNVNTGPFTTQVIIKGSGFSTTADDNKVFFNGKAAIVTSSSATQIYTSVPLAAGTGVVTVAVKGNTATGPVFNYQQTLVVSTLIQEGPADGPGTIKGQLQPNGIAVDAAGNIYVADKGNYIRKITAGGVASVLAGNGTSGTADGIGAAATFSQPADMAVDAAGNIFVCDNDGLLIRKITPEGVVTTFAGNGRSDLNDGIGTAASLGHASGLAFDGSGNLYVADQGASGIRKITPSAVVTTIYKGSGSFTAYGVAVDKSDNIFVDSETANAIDKITSTGTLSLFAGGNFLANTIDGTGSAAAFNYPYHITMDASGNLFVLDSDQRIRKITPDQAVTTFIGYGSGYDGPIGTASFLLMQGIAIDKSGIIYIADQGAVRKISVQ